jgi:hypothetical protein
LGVGGRGGLVSASGLWETTKEETQKGKKQRKENKQLMNEKINLGKLPFLAGRVFQQEKLEKERGRKLVFCPHNR